MRIKHIMFAWGVAVLVAFLGFGLALAEVESYRELKSAPSEVIVDAAAGDSLVATTLLTSRIKSANSNTTVAVRVDFSGSAGDTVVVYCLLYQGTTFLGCYQSTVTAGNVTVSGGDNVGTNLALFDLSGADAYEVRHSTPSSGTIDLTWWAFGSSSQQ